MSKVDLICGALHLLQGSFITGYVASKGTNIPVSLKRTSDYGVAWETTYNIANLLPVFSFLSSTNHVVRYFGGPILGNMSQWMEYGFSASVMLWLIATLSGIVEISVLVNIVILNMLLQYIGYRLTQTTDHSEYHRLLTAGFVLHACIWIPIISTFYAAIQVNNADNIKENQPTVPAIVYYIIWFMFSLFTVFGVYPIFKDITKTSDVPVYPVLSLVTKSLLVWMVFFGIIRQM